MSRMMKLSFVAGAALLFSGGALASPRFSSFGEGSHAGSHHDSARESSHAGSRDSARSGSDRSGRDDTGSRLDYGSRMVQSHQWEMGRR